MLDCYEISDGEKQDEYPIEEKHIGSFSLDDFRQFEDITSFAKSSGFVFHFFTDFRLTNQNVTLLNSKMDALFNNPHVAISPSKKQAFDKLKIVINICLNNNTGFIAFCD